MLHITNPLTKTQPLKLAEYTIALTLMVWLIAAAILINVEYYDGMDAILNIRGILGDAQYIANRGPMMSMLLLPAALITGDSLPAHDFRPYHISMAIFHIVYLISVYTMMMSVGGKNWPTLIAFIFAILSYVFFSYAPFISHDILPGALFLGMIILTNKFLESPSIRIWLLLVALGASAALIKHIFGMFWVVLLISSFIVLALNRNSTSFSWRKYTYLIYGSVASGLITWVTLASVLGNHAEYENISFLLRPYHQLVWLFLYAPGVTEFPWWLYIRNFLAYGCITLIILPFAIYMALARAKPIYQLVASCLLMMLFVMNTIHVKEVRYLAHLSPLLAVLLILPLNVLLQHRAGKFFVILCLIINFSPWHTYSISREVAKIFHPFYRSSLFVNQLAIVDRSNFDLLISGHRLLGFSSGEPSPLVGDPYHSLFHIGSHHLSRLLGFDSATIIMNKEQISQLRSWPDRTIIVSNDGDVLINRGNFLDIYNKNTAKPIQHLSVSRSMTLIRTEDNVYTSENGAKVELLSFTGGRNFYLKYHGPSNELATGYNYRLRADNSEKIFELSHYENNVFHIENVGHDDIRAMPQSMSLKWFKTAESVNSMVALTI